MAYVPNPQDPTQPTENQYANYAADELRALKGYIQALIAGNTSFTMLGGSGRNRLRNGSMRMAQRGVGPITIVNATPAYGLDGWQVLSTGDNSTITQVLATSVNLTGASEVMEIIPGNAATEVSIYQRIAAGRIPDFLQGVPVTFSGLYFNANNPTAPLTPTIRGKVPLAVDNFSGLSGVIFNVAPTLVGLPGTWQSFSATIVLPQNLTTGLQITFDLTASASPVASAGFYLANLQLELGSLQTPFELQTVAQLNAENQVFYQELCWAESCYGVTGSLVQSAVNFPVLMRAAPSLTRTSVVVTNATMSAVPTPTVGYVVDGLSVTTTGEANGSYIGLLSAEF